jgi:hypothetical protein
VTARTVPIAATAQTEATAPTAAIVVRAPARRSAAPWLRVLVVRVRRVLVVPARPVPAATAARVQAVPAQVVRVPAR